MTSEPNPYRVLGVDVAADPEVVATAYRTLARLHHPDVSRHADAERRMAEINAAWWTLRDPQRRAAYDREHGITDGLATTSSPNPLDALRSRPARAGEPRPTEPNPPPGGRPGRVAWRRGPHGEGAAGPPPGRPQGSVLPFGRHIGWSLGEIARVDPGYLQWLAARPDGAPYRTEIESILAPLLRTADGRGFLHPEHGSGPMRHRRR